MNRNISRTNLQHNEVQTKVPPLGTRGKGPIDLGPLHSELPKEKNPPLIQSASVIAIGIMAVTWWCSRPITHSDVKPSRSYIAIATAQLAETPWFSIPQGGISPTWQIPK